MHNPHFPPELKERVFPFPAVGKAIASWRKMPMALPEPARGKLRVSGFAPQHPFFPHKARLPALESPHSMLFRTEDNVSFIAKIFLRWGTLSPQEGFTAADQSSRSLHYSSVGEAATGTLWTPTTSRLDFALANYGAHWSNHFQTDKLDESFLDMLGLAVETRRVLLLAIVPGRNPLFRGMDRDELVVRDRISLRRVYILNDSPRLFSRLADIETAARGLSLHTRASMEERFMEMGSFPAAGGHALKGES